VLPLCLAVTLLALVGAEGADQKETGGPWIVPAQIIRNGQQSGSGVYLRSGLIITAAHLTAADAEMGVRIAGVALPARVMKQGSFEDADLSLLWIDEEKVPTRTSLPPMQLCKALPWPGDEVIVVDAEHASRSHIVSPQVLSFEFRSKYTSLIADVATTGNSGSGVFDPKQKCLLGIMSRKFFSHTPEGNKDIAKYFVPARAIREFIPPEFTPLK
jgi:hypothetical protein